MSESGGLLDRIDPAPALAELQHRPVNYQPEDVNPEEWAFDAWSSPLSAERPGAPEPGGVWEAARVLVAAYEFSDPTVLRAVYAADSPLHGRDMLLEARFYGLRFYMGVRVTEVIDEERSAETDVAPQRVWGWAYETLAGHLERGKIAYEVVKNQDTGQVSFALRAYSQRAPTLGPIISAGWALFGRRVQQRFYRRCGARLARATIARRGEPELVPFRRTADGLVLAPSDARHARRDRFAVRRSQPG